MTDTFTAEDWIIVRMARLTSRSYMKFGYVTPALSNEVQRVITFLTKKHGQAAVLEAVKAIDAEESTT